ncbi:MAG: hypothetical protein J1E43_02655 [Christensenellaceae bacterium]|nr:hypothetical protein [Christensenellaceae bacterium]
MGNFANTLFSSLLGWLRSAAAWLWSFLNDPESGGFIVWMADNWLPLIILLCAACMLIDFLVYLLRWQPYKVWASFFRRVFGHDTEPDDSQRIRRRWIHADGTTSIEEVDAAEVMPDPEPAVFTAQPEEESISARYTRFARPQTEPVFAQPTSEPQPEPAPMPAEEPAEIAERPARPAVGRRRRYVGADEELPLRYAPPPASEDAPAYHEPYYPPQWKRPADTGSSNVDLGGSGL